ncbi:unnamed protein product [Polarella glacialis]|uniref:E3 UFM1-protein ligase 1-like N-terminal domain-containing protein n=1 Tax=Polarella glacialis TaxID=89957 RepID=A0A813HKJ3_POLGL|nr:unnamed protein product [Polarella glacialis]
MEAIRELQRQLQDAQKVSNVKKISERNCIDLVQKLIATDQVKLFHTTTGKEYLTPEQLDIEIREVLDTAGGRLNVTELPNELGVGIEHCEVRVEQMRKRDSSLCKIHSELLSQQYLQAVAQEIEENLEEAGSVAVSDLASRWNLPAEYIRNSVFVLVGSSGVVKQNTIHTGAHAARVEARTLGALRGCTQPVNLSQLALRHSLDADMVAAAAQKLVKEDAVQGKIQGTTFTPKAYTEAQAGRVDSFFDANSYLTVATAKSANVELKDWVKSRKAAGYSLGSTFLAAHLVDPVIAAISEAVSSDSWVDVLPLLPPALAATDSRDLLQQLANQKKLPNNSVLVDRVVVSAAFLKAAAHSLEAETKAAAERAVATNAKLGVS